MLAMLAMFALIFRGSQSLMGSAGAGGMGGGGGMGGIQVGKSKAKKIKNSHHGRCLNDFQIDLLVEGKFHLRKSIFAEIS